MGSATRRAAIAMALTVAGAVNAASLRLDTLNCTFDCLVPEADAELPSKITGDTISDIGQEQELFGIDRNYWGDLPLQTPVLDKDSAPVPGTLPDTESPEDPSGR